MKLFRRILLSTAVVLLGFLLYACQQPMEPEEEYNLFEGLEAVEGAQNTSVTINQGEAVGRDAWFEFEVGNIANNDWISAGTYDGWCIEWTKPIAQQGDRHDNVRVYSTYGEEKYKPLNHFLNIKDDLQEQHSNLDFREAQAIIWSVTQGPEFDLNTLSVDELPTRLTEDGEPNFDMELVKSVADQVLADAVNFGYRPDQTVALFMKTGNDEQDVMVPSDPDRETVSHGYVPGVTPSEDPQYAERTYPVIRANWAGPGGDRQWIAMDLGATVEPTGLKDENPDAAGWQFRFNRLQGYHHNGTDIIPEPHVDTSTPEDADPVWEISNDPCRELLGDNWRIPTRAEWRAVARAEAAHEQLNLHFNGGLDLDRPSNPPAYGIVGDWVINPPKFIPNDNRFAMFFQDTLTESGETELRKTIGHAFKDRTASAARCINAPKPEPIDLTVGSVSHGHIDGVTPVDIEDADRTYPVIQANWSGPGGDQRWLGRNLGAAGPPVHYDDENPDNAGWYFRFHHEQGFYHDYELLTSPEGWEEKSIVRDEDWLLEDDPCQEALGGTWRIPTEAEWRAAFEADDTILRLKLHHSGGLFSSGEIFTIRVAGYYWASDQENPEEGVRAIVSEPGLDHRLDSSTKNAGYTLRCIED